MKPLEEDDCDNNCTISADGSGDNATEVLINKWNHHTPKMLVHHSYPWTKTVSTCSELVFQVATGDEPECEYYDDWWIFGEEGSGDSAEDGEVEEEANFRRRRRRQAEDGSGDGSADGGDEAADGGGGGNGTVADGDGGNSTKKEIDLSIFSKRCKPEKV